MESSLSNDNPSLSPSKEIKNSKRKTYHQIHHRNYHQHQNQQQPAFRLPNILRQSKYSQKVAPSPPPHVQLEMVHATNNKGSVFLNHFPNSINKQISLPTFPSILPSHPYYHYHHHNNHHPPPLLPLPVAFKPTFFSLPTLPRQSSLSSSTPKKQTKQKTLKTPTPPFTNKKSSTTTPQKNIKKKETKNNIHTDMGSTKEVDPNSKSDPEKVKGIEDLKEENDEEINKISITPLSSIFCLAPPPSSLPLPKFSSRQVQQSKISCKAQAALDDVDAGVATDNLCQLLKLR